jgi:hypothetical protein
MAMGEAYVLAQELDRHSDDYRSAFMAYEKVLKPTTTKKQRDAMRISRFFVPSDGSIVPLRRLFQKDVLQQSSHKIGPDDLWVEGCLVRISVVSRRLVLTGPTAEVSMFRKRITTQLVALGLSMGLITPVLAGPFEDATAAYGRGDFTTALRLLRSLADQGDTEAQNALAVMYEKGEGVAQDFATALMWYRKAADQGDAEAQLNLGNLYVNGQGVPRDYVMAHMWFDLAAAAGIEDASRDRDVIARRMTSAQIEEAQKIAREWKPKSD